MRSNVVEILEERGLLSSLTSNTLRSVCSDPTLPHLTVYCGFDPTAESLHLGNLLGLIVLSWFLRCGHRAIAVLGGATARIGDPSGKSIERPKLHPSTVERNTADISTTIRYILSQVEQVAYPSSAFFSSSFAILNNYDWWKHVMVVDFLDNVGRCVRLGSMMSMEIVRKRLKSGQGMSYGEFIYPLLQGYDFLHLFCNEGVSVQIGGSDQWGNITVGTELIRKKILHGNIGTHQIIPDRGAYGLTFPLLLKGDGTKFGKSESGAIWLAPSLLSPHHFYQYFLSIPDNDVLRFLRILTFLEMEEITQLEREMQSFGYVSKTAQRRLAEEVTLFVHGPEGLEDALKRCH